MKKVIIEKLYFPVDGYLYNAKIFQSVDGGKNFYYCGNGRYFKTIDDANEYKNKVENK